MDSVVELMVAIARSPMATGEQRSRARAIVCRCGDPYQALQSMMVTLHG